MNNSNDGWLFGAMYGSVGGLIQLMLQVGANETYMEKLGSALLTAFLCGMAGGIGKWIVDFFKSKISKKND